MTKTGFQDRISLNAGQKYYRVLFCIISTFIKISFVITIFVLSIFEWPFNTGLTVSYKSQDRIPDPNDEKGKQNMITLPQLHVQLTTNLLN